MAAIGMAAGIALGIALPFVLNAAFAAFLPFPFVPGVFPASRRRPHLRHADGPGLRAAAARPRA